MAAGEGGDSGGGAGVRRTGSLEETPTWALATVCFAFIFVGLLIEHLIHLASLWLKKRKKSSLFEAMEKLKSVLILLGFMSLLLTATQRSISKICISNRTADTMQPCRSRAQPKNVEHFLISVTQKTSSETEQLLHYTRQLAEEYSSDKSLDHCTSKGMTSLISQVGINQLSIFMFVLAAMQILYSMVTMALGRAKMKRWKGWEKETQTVEYMAANDPQRFRYTRQTTFGRRHVNLCSTNPALLWIKCFLRQFFRSVAKIDYLTLRHGFISAHLPGNNSFNFQKYIQRSLEDDFKAVVGISPIMWLVVVMFLLIDVHGWNAYLWVSFLPLTIVLAIGTKLEVIVAEMAMQITDQNTVIKGTPLVQPNNDLFWFKRPQLVLTLLHFTLFMNSFEIGFFIWVTWQFGIKSCYHENVEIIIIRAVLALMVQILCSYITLPLYALVTQMGSQYKRAILEEHTLETLKQWHADAKDKRKREASSHEHRIQDDPVPTLWSNRTASPNESSHGQKSAPKVCRFVDISSDEITEFIDDRAGEIQRQHLSENHELEHGDRRKNVDRAT